MRHRPSWMSGYVDDTEKTVRVHALLCVARDLVMDAKLEAKDIVPFDQYRVPIHHHRCDRRGHQQGG